MEYRSGKVGRVFALRFDDGDDFLEGLRKVTIKEKIRNGWFHILGGIREADVVTGPKQPVMPPEPVWTDVQGARETVGFGSVFWEGEDPKFHLHAAMGHHGETLTACVRKNTKVYLVLEVYLVEIAGFSATRPWDEKCGFNKLTFS